MTQFKLFGAALLASLLTACAPLAAPGASTSTQMPAEAGIEK